MEECELCGNKINDVYIINLDGTELRVCTECAEGKVVIGRSGEKVRVTPMRRSAAKEEETLKENYGRIIREARERMKLPIKVLAEMIKEKETFILRAEEQTLRPDVKLAKKLEKALKIKLFELQEPASSMHGRGNSEGATLGEFVER